LILRNILVALASLFKAPANYSFQPFVAAGRLCHVIHIGRSCQDLNEI
jgi:hypothetical protein